MEEKMRENVSSLLPVITEFEKPFWDSLEAGQLLVQKCDRCGHRQFPPAPVCTECLSEDVQWAECSNRATLWSKVAFHKAYLKPYQDVPYAVAVARLEEGVLIEGRLSMENYEKLPLDSKVRAKYIKSADGTTLVEFVPET